MNLFKQLYLIYKYRQLVRKIINRDVVYQTDYLLKKYNIDRLKTLDLLTLFDKVDERIENYTFLEGNSLITDITLLIKLAKSFDSCRFLEIGSWKGETISNIAKYATECVSLTLSKEEMLEMGISNKFAEVEGLFMNKPNIERIYCNTLKYDFSVLKRKFDLIFIDGGHDYNTVLSDTKNCHRLLKDSNSVIVWHDYGTTPENVNPVVLSAILDAIPSEEHKYLYHVSNTLCAIYIKKEFKSNITVFPTYPNKVFSIDINSIKLE